MGIYGQNNYHHFFRELDDQDTRAQIVATGCKVLTALILYCTFLVLATNW